MEREKGGEEREIEGGERERREGRGGERDRERERGGGEREREKRGGERDRGREREGEKRGRKTRMAGPPLDRSIIFYSIIYPDDVVIADAGWAAKVLIHEPFDEGLAVDAHVRLT